MPDCHYSVTRKNVQHNNHLIYYDTVSVIYQNGIYELIKVNKQHVHLSDGVRDDLRNNANNDLLRLTQKAYSFNHQR